MSQRADFFERSVYQHTWEGKEGFCFISLIIFHITRPFKYTCFVSCLMFWVFFTFNRKSIASSNFSLAQVPTGGGGVASPLLPPLSVSLPPSLSPSPLEGTLESVTLLLFSSMQFFFQFIYWIMDLVVSFTWGRKGVSLCGSDLHDLCDLLTSSTAARPPRHLHHPHYCCYHTTPHNTTASLCILFFH